MEMLPNAASIDTLSFDRGAPWSLSVARRRIETARLNGDGP
jgi:hypothetical protein